MSATVGRLFCFAQLFNTSPRGLRRLLLAAGLTRDRHHHLSFFVNRGHAESRRGGNNACVDLLLCQEPPTNSSHQLASFVRLRGDLRWTAVGDEELKQSRGAEREDPSQLGPVPRQMTLQTVAVPMDLLLVHLEHTQGRRQSPFMMRGHRPVLALPVQMQLANDGRGLGVVPARHAVVDLGHVVRPLRTDAVNLEACVQEMAPHGIAVYATRFHRHIYSCRPGLELPRKRQELQCLIRVLPLHGHVHPLRSIHHRGVEVLLRHINADDHVLGSDRLAQLCCVSVLDPDGSILTLTHGDDLQQYVGPILGRAVRHPHLSTAD